MNTGPVVVAIVLALPVALAGCTSGAPESARIMHGQRSASASSTTAPSTAGASTSRPIPTPTASTDARGSYPTVGALFPRTGSGQHTCTASVVASTSDDTIITAAHCLSGTAVGMTFVPGYHEGRAPYGTWRVTGAYVSAAWQRERSPAADYAVLTVAPRSVGGRLVHIADVTGAERLGLVPAAGSTVTVVAYNNGSGDDPIACRTTVFFRDGYPTFDCHGFVNGSSGSPWLSADQSLDGWILRGVVGGPHQGGCFEYRSTSAAFTDDVRALLVRAASGAAADAVTARGDSGC